MVTKMVRRKGAVHVTYVSSTSEPDKEYQIARLPGGTLACACVGFAFNKHCRHLPAAEEWLRALQAAPSHSVQRRKAVQRPDITVSEETFTFRAISFDTIPTGRTP